MAKQTNTRTRTRPRTTTRSMAMSKVREMSPQLEQKARKAMHMTKRKFQTAEKRVEGYVKRHPAKAALIAAAIGAAITAGAAGALKKKR
ncbi:hypothetical protein KW805_04435 [Candidatus Pacearchaeota archaeon]|nr:hypothetical protein [Candidatus Pacearchaeota archaeon]